jgi:hypothetical protein
VQRSTSSMQVRDRSGEREVMVLPVDIVAAVLGSNEEQLVAAGGWVEYIRNVVSLLCLLLSADHLLHVTVGFKGGTDVVRGSSLLQASSAGRRNSWSSWQQRQARPSQLTLITVPFPLCRWKPGRSCTSSGLLTLGRQAGLAG